MCCTKAPDEAQVQCHWSASHSIVRDKSRSGILPLPVCSSNHDSHHANAARCRVYLSRERMRFKLSKIGRAPCGGCTLPGSCSFVRSRSGILPLPVCPNNHDSHRTNAARCRVYLRRERLRFKLPKISRAAWRAHSARIVFLCIHPGRAHFKARVWATRRAWAARACESSTRRKHVSAVNGKIVLPIFRPAYALYTLPRRSPSHSVKQTHPASVRSNPYSRSRFSFGFSGEPGVQIVWTVACGCRAVRAGRQIRWHNGRRVGWPRTGSIAPDPTSSHHLFEPSKRGLLLPDHVPGKTVGS
jgi:hypothetical protein